MKAKSLKKAFIASCLSLVMCLSMLVGTTFAWFTDSVTNNVNQIVSGNLDVELHHTKDYNDDATAYEVVVSDTALYDNLVWVHGADSYEATAWQPNVESTEGFKIENKGTLPLKYKFSLLFANATATPAGKTLADVLVIAVEDANGVVDSFEGTTVLKNFVYEGTLEAGETYEFTTNIAWNQSANDNEYNVAGGLKIDIGVRLLATQLSDEAEYVGDVDGIADFVSTPEQLASAMKGNGKVVLTNSITLPDDFETMFDAARNGTSYTGEGFKGVLDGCGNTIYNAPSTLIGCLDGGTIKNLTIVASVGSSISTYASESSDSIGGVVNLMYGGVIENVTVSGTVIGEKAVGGIVGRMIGDGTIRNCVNNATVESTGSNDAAGGIVGKAYYTFTGKEMNIVGCTNNGEIKGGYAAGGIAGFSAANISNCENNGEVLSTGASAGGIVGEQTNYGALTNNTNTANISASGAIAHAGGIVGWIRYQSNPSAYQLNKVVDVSGNYNSATSISSTRFAGGVIGVAYDQVTANRNYVTAETILASDTVLGIASGILGHYATSQGLVIPTDVRFTVTGNVVSGTTLEAKTTNEYAPVSDLVNANGNMVLTTVSTADELTTAIANGEAVLLNNDIEISSINLTNVNHDVFINANGFTITTSNPYGIETTAGKNVTFMNGKIQMTYEGNYITYASGLKIANGDYTGNTVTLKDCTITMANEDWAYAVNLPASVFNLNLVIDNCTLEGSIAVQCWGDNNNIAITDSKLVCNYTTSKYYTSFCVVLQKDGSLVSENNTLTMDNCSFEYSGVDAIGNGIISFSNLGVNNTVSATNCTYGKGVVTPEDSWL